MKTDLDFETGREVKSRVVLVCFTGRITLFSQGLFDSETNIIRSFFTCKFFADYFSKKTVFTAVVLR